MKPFHYLYNDVRVTQNNQSRKRNICFTFFIVFIFIFTYLVWFRLLLCSFVSFCFAGLNRFNVGTNDLADGGPGVATRATPVFDQVKLVSGFLRQVPSFNIYASAGAGSGSGTGDSADAGTENDVRTPPTTCISDCSNSRTT